MATQTFREDTNMKTNTVVGYDDAILPDRQGIVSYGIRYLTFHRCSEKIQICKQIRWRAMMTQYFQIGKVASYGIPYFTFYE